MLSFGCYCSLKFSDREQFCAVQCGLQLSLTKVAPRVYNSQSLGPTGPRPTAALAVGVVKVPL